MEDKKKDLTGIIIQGCELPKKDPIEAELISFTSKKH
jgi:hypothetical protein